MFKKILILLQVVLMILYTSNLAFAAFEKETIYEEDFEGYRSGTLLTTAGFSKENPADGVYIVSKDPTGNGNKCAYFKKTTQGDIYLCKYLPQLVDGTVTFDLSIYITSKQWHIVQFFAQKDDGSIIQPFGLSFQNEQVTVGVNNDNYPFKVNQWGKFSITVDTVQNIYSIKLNDKTLVIRDKLQEKIKYMTEFRYYMLEKNAPMYIDDLEVSYTSMPMEESASSMPKEIPLVNVKNKVINVSEAGAIPDDDIDDTAAIHAAIESAIKAGPGVTVVFNKGRYILGEKPDQSTRYVISHLNAKDITLMGNDTELYLTNPFTGAILFNNSSGITINGFTIRYKTAPWAQGNIEKINKEEGNFLYRVMDGYDILKDPQMTQPEKSFGAVMSSKDENLLKVEAVFISSYTLIEPGLYKMIVPSGSSELNYMDEGDKLVFTNRTMAGEAFNIARCSNVALKNIKIYESAGCLILGAYMEGDIIIDNVSSEFDKGNWICSNADGVHIQSLRGRFLMSNCSFEGLLDDCINLYQQPGPVTSVQATDELTLWHRNGNFPWVGDTIIIVDPKKGVERGRAIVKSVTPDVNDTLTCQVKLKSPITNIKSGAVLGESDQYYLLECMFPGSVIQNNVFKKSRRYGALIKTNGTLFEKNTFKDLGSSALIFEPEFNIDEGPFACKQTIRNNTFINCGYLSYAKQPIGSFPRGSIMILPDGANYQASPDKPAKDYIIENNTFDKMPQFGVTGRGVDGLILKNNTFKGDADEEIVSPDVGSIYFDNIANAQIIDNKINDQRKKISREIFLGRGASKVTIKNNTFDLPKGTVDIEEESPIPKYDFEIPKLKSNIQMDGNLDDWPNENIFNLNSETDAAWFKGDYTSSIFNASGKMTWDENNLYIGIDVHDIVHFQSQNSNSLWKDDSVQFAVDSERIGVAGSKGYVECTVGMTNDGKVLSHKDSLVDGISSGDIAGLKVNIKRNEDKKSTIYELEIPWTDLVPASFRVSDGCYIGFSLLINDNDGDGRKGFLQFYSGIGSGAKSPALYGTAVLCQKLGSVAKEYDFKDIQGHWAKREIEMMAFKKIINGMNETTFSPDSPVTIAEFLSMVVREKGYTLSQYKGGLNDIYSGNWYADSIQTALDQGILDGGFLAKNSILPDHQISRAEAAAVISRAFSLNTVGDVNIFDIDQVPLWLVRYVKCVMSANIMNGYDGDWFKPNDCLTRAQAAVILSRLMEN